jgi:hypothetical protein
MDTILTWSGSASHDVASFFRDWLTEVLPGIQPWISDQDIAKGRKWFSELMEQLSKTAVSITFVTPENVRSPWIYYEVGVIAAKNADCIVCPYLIGIQPSQVNDTPLGQFQCTIANREDTFRLIRSINSVMGDRGHHESLLEGNFESRWSKLKRKLERVQEDLVPLEDDVTSVEPPIEQQLSAEARSLLLEATEKDSDGQIIYISESVGTSLQANNKNMIPDESPRVVALWKAVMEELLDFGLVRRIGFDADVFEVTKKGYDIADLIRSRT